MRALLLGCVVGLLAALGAVAASAEVGRGDIEMSALLDSDGTGALFVNNTDGPWRWESCTPELTGCRRVPGGRKLSTRGVRPPAVFRVRSDGLVGISPQWKGRVEQIAPPSVTGFVRANEFVSPMPGRWARGWKAELSELQLSACVTAQGTDCTTLTHSHYLRPCSMPDSLNASFVVPEKFAGQYLRVAERRLGAGPIARLMYAVGSPYGGRILRRDGATSVAIVGRIAASTRGYPGECGPPVPGVGSISKRGLGLVHCSEGCRATLIGAREGRVVKVGRTVGASRSALFVGPPEQIALPPTRLAKLGEGPVTFALRVDGRLQDIRTIRSSA